MRMLIVHRSMFTTPTPPTPSSNYFGHPVHLYTPSSCRRLMMRSPFEKLVCVWFLSETPTVNLLPDQQSLDALFDPV